MEKFSNPLAEDYADRMRAEIATDPDADSRDPKLEDYEKAFQEIGMSFGDLHDFISRLTVNPEIIEAVGETEGYRQAVARISSMVFDRLAEIDPKLREAILSQKGLLGLIIHQVIFSIDEDYVEQKITKHYDNIVKEYGKDFTPKEIADEISRAEGLDVGSIELVEICKDKYGETFRLSFDLVGETADNKSEQELIIYNCKYPHTEDGLARDRSLYPVVTKEMHVFDDTRRKGNRYKKVSEEEILRFVAGVWQNVSQDQERSK